MRTRLVVALLVAMPLLTALLPREATGVPVFARKYGFTCTMCHSNFPRLNDFGQRYRENAYRLPGRENEEKTVLETTAPIALRTSAGYNAEKYDHAEGGDDLSAFQLNGLDLLSAGVVASDIGYLVVYVPQVAEGRGVAGQDGSLEMASVVLGDLTSIELDVRVGRFEPAYVPFSVKRQLSVSPYEIYDRSFPDGVPFSETQSGLELSGRGGTLFRYAAGVVTGSEGNRAHDNPTDIYGRLACVIGPGEGQTAGQRLGVVGYLGRARPADGTGARESFFRVGGDASLNLPHFNLALQYLYGSDDESLWPGFEEDDVTWSGGFAEIGWLPRVDITAFARYDHVDAPSIEDADVDRATLGGRYYLDDNVALHLEYSYRVEKFAGEEESPLEEDDDATLSFVTTRLDFAF